MARPISDEELQLKKRARRRLVGAIVLVTAIAVVLPMILDSEPQPSSQNVEIQIPSPNAGEFKPKSAAAPSDADKSAKAAPGSDKRGDSASAEPVAAITEPTTPRSEKIASAKPAASEKSGSSPDAAAPAKPEKSSASKDAAPKSASSTADGAYVVQVAALSDAAKAKALEKRMSGAGLKTYTEVVTTASGRVTRVRAGPYSSRDAAEKARVQLKKAGFDGQVMAK
jgi:DedD protein